MSDQQATGPSDASPASPPSPPPDTSWYAAAAAMETGPDVPPSEVTEPHRALGFGEAVGACLRQYGTFSGRAQRSEYWWWALFNLLVFVAVGLSRGVVGADATAVDVVAVIAGLALLLPNLAVTVRRLHDVDRSGWWILINFVPVVGSIILLVFAMLPGTPGENRFGLAPMPPSLV